MISDMDILLLCNYDEQLCNISNPAINKLWSGEWCIENKEVCREMLATGLETELLLDLVKKYSEDREKFDIFRQTAIKSLLTFCDRNWNPHPEVLDIKEFLGSEWPREINVKSKLERDSEPIFENILYPELLYFATQIFSVLYSVQQSLLNLWWHFRGKVIHQRCLEDTSATLYSELELIAAKLSNELQSIQEKPRVSILLCLEMAQVYLMYGRVQKVQDFLQRARDLAGLKLELIGIMGKRTKFQRQEVPQLALSSELDPSLERPSAEESHGNSELPPDVELNDDVRLNKIQYNEKISIADLPSLEQNLCLLTVQYIQKSQPKDDLTSEEIQAYIETILSQKKGAWSTRVAALLIRCKLEASHKRTVERAMQQCEAIVNDKTGVAPTNRLSYLWASGLQPAWTWRQQLADLYLSLGLVKAALEEYLSLQMWEDVIVCYTVLQLRQKAAEVIRQQIDVAPSVKLYCLLGDATDDESYYEKAWEFSNYKSSRAQRHWGNFFFGRKMYEECIPHYEKSLEINSLQETVWLRLGFAALMQENWELSAKAYRRYTYLQPNTFEAWNNLAKIYVKQGDKSRAYRALMEALKFNYDNWKLWENVVIVSIDTGHFSDVIRGIHRILELTSKFDDIEVLTLLTRAVVEGTQDADGNSAGSLRKNLLELFGRITSIYQNKPEIWQLYADASPTYLLRAQRLLRAYRGFTQSGKWAENPVTCEKVIKLAIDMMESSKKAREDAEEKDKFQADQQLSSARLTGQAVIRVSEKQDWPETRESLHELKELFTSVTEYMKSIM